jgi:hypothetical protein
MKNGILLRPMAAADADGVYRMSSAKKLAAES